MTLFDCHLTCNNNNNNNDLLFVCSSLARSLTHSLTHSLTQAAELEELVCSTAVEYEELAVSLAVDEERYMAMRTKLESNRDSLPLFDTKRWVANAEEGFARMWQRYEQGLPPDHIDVPDMLGKPTLPEEA